MPRSRCLLTHLGLLLTDSGFRFSFSSDMVRLRLETRVSQRRAEQRRPARPALPRPARPALPRTIVGLRKHYMDGPSPSRPPLGEGRVTWEVAGLT